MARKRNPLPRNTVENRRSSTATPICSRTTPMNHKNAMPANGTRLRPTRISLRREASPSSDCRLSSLSATRIIIMAAMSRTANAIPARAAARRLHQKRAVSTGPLRGLGDVRTPRGRKIRWSRAPRALPVPSQRSSTGCRRTCRSGEHLSYARVPLVGVRPGIDAPCTAERRDRSMATVPAVVTPVATPLNAGPVNRDGPCGRRDGRYAD
jgi:hypothetical protein